MQRLKLEHTSAPKALQQDHRALIESKDRAHEEKFATMRNNYQAAMDHKDGNHQATLQQ